MKSETQEDLYNGKHLSIHPPYYAMLTFIVDQGFLKESEAPNTDHPEAPKVCSFTTFSPTFYLITIKLTSSPHPA